MQFSAEIWDSTVSLNTSQQISTSGGIFVCESHSAVLLFWKSNLIYTQWFTDLAEAFNMLQ